MEWRSFPSDHYDTKALARLIGSLSARVLVAEKRGRVIGFVIVQLRKNQLFGRVMSLAVTPKARKSGVGSALLAAAELACRRRGFGVSQVLSAYYADGADALRMRKLVTPLSASVVVAFRRKT